MAKKNIKYKGFTIIEVVLVLAIAGLIMLMVFIALPALQRSQKDTQRKQDMSRFMSQLTSYQSNNRNAIPTGDPKVTGCLNSDDTCKTSNLKTDGSWKGFYNNYLLAGTDDFADPDGVPYNLVMGTTDSNGGSAAQNDEFGTHNIHVYINGICNGENVEKSTGSRKVAITYKLEGGGVACYNN